MNESLSIPSLVMNASLVVQLVMLLLTMASIASWVVIFQRSFVLADGVEVVSAQIENGLLHVDLKRVKPQQLVQTIPISRK